MAGAASVAGTFPPPRFPTCGRSPPRGVAVRRAVPGGPPCFAFSLPTITLGKSVFQVAIFKRMIESAVVPVAGFGTRLLPATKSQPKEMLPVARKPIVQYVVEELVSNGVQQILFVTGRNKTSIENHFDHDPELARMLAEANKGDLLKELNFEALKANFFYTRQRMQKGLGDAVLCAESFEIQIGRAH